MRQDKENWKIYHGLHCMRCEIRQDRASYCQMGRDKARNGKLGAMSWSLRCKIRQDRAS